MSHNAARRPVLCHRLFFAILPPPPVARQIAQSAVWFGREGANVNPDRLHITMDILDDFEAFPRDVADMMIAVGNAVVAAPPPIVLDRIAGSNSSVALRSRRTLKVLEKTGGAIAAARAQMGLQGRADYEFRPHMTLFYRKGPRFNRAIHPVCWEAEEFVLIHSLVGRTRYEILARWRFGLDAEDEDGEGQFRLL